MTDKVDVTFYLHGGFKLTVPQTDITNETIEAIFEEHGRMRFQHPDDNTTTIYKTGVVAFEVRPSA